MNSLRHTAAVRSRGFLCEARPPGVRARSFSVAATVVVISLMALFTAALGLAAGPGPEDKGLVLHYDFEEGKGDVAKDRSGKGNDGKIHNAHRVAGYFGRAIEFNGKNSWIDCSQGGKDSSLDISQAGTLSLWYVALTNRGGGLLSWATGMSWTDQRLVLAFYNAHVLWAMSDGESALNHQPLKARLNTWTHLALTFDGAKVIMYKDGKRVQSVDQTRRPAVKDVPLVIGKSSGLGPPFFDGAMDDVRIYNRALSADEIRAIYKKESGGR